MSRRIYGCAYMLQPKIQLWYFRKLGECPIRTGQMSHQNRITVYVVMYVDLENGLDKQSRHWMGMGGWVDGGGMHEQDIGG